jgi:RNA recognition motif-containing protein
MSRLFVGNIPHACKECDLQSWFEQKGQPVESVQIIRDRISGHSRGFGFVQLKGAGDVKNMIEQLNGMRLSGRTLTVGEATPRVPQRAMHTQFA